MGDKACKKLVKVDNWGMFFLQRLQQHFSRDEFCDFTLHFTNGEKVKAHRLVLDVCTEYFQILQNQGLFVGNVVNMPEDMLPDVVVPVVNFMYTGRLEFRADIQERLYATAQKMKMTVLTKLLDAQSLNTQQQLKSQQTAKAKPNQVSPKKLPPGTFTNLQGKKVSPRIVDPNLAVTLPGRKLPIWKRRSIPIYSQAANTATQFDQPIRIITTPAATEPPRPTRIEWPDDTGEPSTSPLAATFEDISYESKPLMQLKQPKPNILVREKAPVVPAPVEKKATFEDVYRTGAVGLAKRPATDSISPESAKKAKTVDMQAMKEYLQEAHVRSRMIEGEDSEEDVDDDLDGTEMMNNDEEDEEEEENDDNDEDSSFEQNIVTPHKSILKTSSCTDDETPSNKRVRFSVDDGCAPEKENEAKLPEPRTLPTRALSNITAASTPTATNHAKIISEVLKKYPHLVKNNKNIRLKIMQRGGSPATQQTFERDAANKPMKSKVSYVVLKSDATSGRMKGLAAMGSKPVPQAQRTTFPKVASGVDNVDGPWLCQSCGTEDAPLQFPTYYAYRRHLQDVHQEKVDVRICEHCGHRASKRNLLLYHLYTKHNVAPPRSCSFPKCDQCDYVALSEGLLAKHRNNHTTTGRDYVCRVCNTGFRSQGALAGHMQTNLHQTPNKKDYECPHCAKPFSRNINLKVHIRQSHRELVKQPEEEDGDFEAVEEEEEEGEDADVMLEVPVLDGTDETATGMTILAEAPASLEPSSEAEGLGHVASGIATSLGLTDGQQTVILLDNNQEYILHTTEVEGTEFGVLDGTLVQEGGSFIVPDMMDGDEVAHAEREEEEGIEEPQESNPAESEEHMAQNSGEVMMVLSDHCYAEDKDENQLQVNHTQDDNLMHLQGNELGGLDFVQHDDVSAESKLVVGDNVRRIVFTNKSKRVKTHVPQPPVLLPAVSDVEPQHVEESPAAACKPAEMSNLLDDWDEECTEDMEGSVERAVRNLHNAMPTRDETYIMSNAAVREDSFLQRQELAPAVTVEDLPLEPALDSSLPVEKEITPLVSNNIDNGEDNVVETAESDSRQQITGLSDQHLLAAEDSIEDESLPKDQAEEDDTSGASLLPSSENETTVVPSTIDAVVSEVLEEKESENLSVQEVLEGTQYTQDNVVEANELSAVPNEVVENNHSDVLSDENETAIKEEVDDDGVLGKVELATGEVSEKEVMQEAGDKAE